MSAEEIIYCDLCDQSIPKISSYAVVQKKKVCSQCLVQLAPSIPERKGGLGIPPPQEPKDIRPWGMGPLRAGFLMAIGFSLWAFVWTAVVGLALVLSINFAVKRLGDRLAPLLKNTALDSELAKELLQSLKTREEGTGRQENFLEPVSPEPQSEPVP